MDSESVKDLLQDITVSVLQTAAFLFVDEEDIELSENDVSDFKCASIQFSGFKDGRVFLWMPAETADIAARNMLGIDDDFEVNDKQRDDVHMEMLNMITGNLLTGIYGDKVIFKLCIPEITNSVELSEMVTDTTVAISVEESPLVVSIAITEG